ncbi:cytochrome c peroxidase [Roseibacillus persicicus]|uniref:cytochrome c peroxidase n=1 Tax=Roseibacillus persicicus TaxID=454148 RepID=UPI00280DA735|nr:cytochrome c peroxidase [Roseibacillus persicicus]MDQ8189243.1 cytochrome c peroxidase [Roseibacillus persicicus]
MPTLFKTTLLLCALGLSLARADSTFEPRPVHPLAITLDGSRLLAVNPAEGRLSVFAVGPAEHIQPLLISEIPVGLVPVSVRLLNDDEAWVVNELSDTISIVSLSNNNTIATIHTGDEPADVAFSQGKAYVTCSRDNSVEVFNVVTREKTNTLALEGLLPRAITPSADGTQIHVGFQHTSNGTTILPRTEAPAQTVPEYANPALPAPPQVAQIVSIDDPAIDYTVLDHDIATIAVATDSVVYQGGIGTNILALTTLENGSLAAANSEARNLISFEPELRSRFARSRLANISSSGVSQLDLNDDPDLTFPLIESSSASSALAQPMALLAAEDDQVWLAAYGSDRLALVDTDTATILQRVDLRALDAPEAPRDGQTVRGPRGLALHPSAPFLYSYNKLSHTLSIINTTSHLVVGEVDLASFPDLDPDLKMGRAFLQDARLSGNGSVSCATCHLDLERDGMAWDLGDPTGSMLTVTGFLRSVHLYDTAVNHSLHPMKGPMTTQTLFGLRDQTKLHWRGDKASIQSFNSTFPNLMGGSRLASQDMDKVANYLLTLNHHPNPNLKLDRSPPDEINGGDPLAGVAVFAKFDNHCIECHSLPSGTSNNLDLPSTVSSFQALKDPPLRTLYQRQFFNAASGETSITGFGMLSDGSGSAKDFPIVHPYSLHILDEPSRPQAVRDQEKLDLTAFLLSFDTGTAPSVGAQVTFRKDAGFRVEELQELITLQNQTLGDFASSDLVLRGTFQGERRSFRFNPQSEKYESDSNSVIPQTFSELYEEMQSGDVLIATGVPLGSASRFSTDRNNNQIADREEALPELTIDADRELTWSREFSGWHLQKSNNLSLWSPHTAPATQSDTLTAVPGPDDKNAFFRLQRNW